MRRIWMFSLLLPVALATPASAQLGGRLAVEPYVGYGFFGDLGDSNLKLDAAIAFGGRASFQLSEQFALFGNFQRSQPEVLDFIGRESPKVDVHHYSAGVEFSYVPRGGAEGMLPVLLEAGLGQARYGFEELGGREDQSDLAVNLGIASALQFSPNFAIRYGANDYISNYGGDGGIVNHLFVRVGAELKF